MAPKRKKKTTEAPRGSDAATLIAQCPRAALEELAPRTQRPNSGYAGDHWNPSDAGWR